MFYQRALLAVAAGFGLLQAGCLAQNDEMGVEAIDGVGFGVMAPDDTDPTNTSHNGLETWKFHAKKGQLAAAFLQPLYSSGVTPNSVVQALTASNNPDGQKVFRYAAKCMVPDGTNINIAGQAPYTGLGLLNMATVWPNWGLGSQGMNEAFACMAAHLNPSGTPVPIKLGGLPIEAAPVDPNAPPDAFTFKEALWATVVTGSIITIHVWPLKDLKDQCTVATNAAMATRVCGTPTGSCNLVIHPSTISECLASTTPGVYQKCYINGTLTNVIQTWLNPGDVPILYGACAPPL